MPQIKERPSDCRSASLFDRPSGADPAGGPWGAMENRAQIKAKIMNAKRLALYRRDTTDPEELQEQLAQIGEKGVQIRIMDGTQEPST